MSTSIPPDEELSMFASLRSRNFRVYLVGTGVSMAGSWLSVIATSLIVYDVTDSGLALGIVGACQLLPVFVFSAWAGLLADRYDKRRSLLILQSFGLCQSVALAWVAMMDSPPVALLCVFAALRGSTASLDLPIRRSMVIETVPARLIPNAIALNSATMSSALVLGASLGGALVAILGYPAAFLTDGASFVVGIVALARIQKLNLMASVPTPRERGQLRDSIASIRSVPELRVPLMVTALSGAAYNFAVVLPVLVSDGFHRPTTAFTYLYSAVSIGAVTGALLIARKSHVDLRLLTQLAFALGMCTIALGLNPIFYLAFPISVAVGVAGYALLSGSLTVLQTNSPPNMRGRTVSFHSISSIGAWAVTAPFVGWLCETAGPRIGIVTTGCTCVLAAAWTSAHIRGRTHGGGSRSDSSEVSD